MTHSTRIDHAALLLRLSLGLLFIAHGLTKLLVFTPEGTAGFFESVGFPGTLAYPVMLAEIFGGAALITGFATRIVALVLLPLMLGATSVHFGNGWAFANPNGGWEFPAFWTVTLIVQALLGSGSFALTANRPEDGQPALTA